MNNKITFHQLAGTLSRLTSSSDETAEAFLKGLTDLIAETLSRGESITIKGIGSFAPGFSDSQVIIWQPADSLAEAVNEPFAAFEPVELGMGVTEELLAHGLGEDIPAQQPEPVHVPDIPSTSTGQHTATLEEEVVETEQEDEAAETAKEDAEEPALDDDTVNEADETIDSTTEIETALSEGLPIIPPIPETGTPVPPPLPEPMEENERHSGFNPWIALCAGIVIGIAIGYFGGKYYHHTTTETVREMPATDTDTIIPGPTDTIAVEDIDSIESKAPVVAEAVDAPKVFKPLAIDTVTTSRYLTTMSRKYYGNYRFWVYIFEENDSIIKNPNRIRPGTAVIIPAPEKYGIDANNPESVRRAVEKSKEISEKIK